MVEELTDEPASDAAARPLIVTLMDAEKALMCERSAQAAKDFRLAVRPILATHTGGPRPRPRFGGTCTLLNIDGCAIMVTAAHTLDRRDDVVELSLAALPGKRPVMIEGGRGQATKPPQGNRRRDPFDFAYWNMPDKAVWGLGPVRFIDPLQVSHNRAPAERRYYMAMGYAQSRNRKSVDNARRAIRNRQSRYTGSVVEIPALAAELGVSGADHMFLRYDERAQSEDDMTYNAICPTGFSGGPLLDLGDFTSPEAYFVETTHRANLSGILIEYRQEYKAIVAVKIGPIVARIRMWLQRRLG